MINANFKIVDDAEISENTNGKSTGDKWKILVVDDDDDVHLATKFALKNITIEGQSLDLIHCYSAAEALEALKNHKEIAVAFIDVVMESPDAGLTLIEDIRSDNKHANMRIVLRTGQPGYAPELSVITQYDINVYVNKSEFTKTRLLSTLIPAIRSYNQLEIISRSRQGLEIIVRSTVDLFNRPSLHLFAQGVLTQFMALMGNNADGFVSIYNPSIQLNSDTLSQHTDSLPLYRVLVATEPYEQYIDKTLESTDIDDLERVFEVACSSEIALPRQGAFGLHLVSHQGVHLFVYVDTWHKPFPNFISLLKIFINNIAVAFDNLTLIERLDSLAFEDPVTHLPNRNSFVVEYKKLQEAKTDFVFLRIRLESLDRHISALGPNITDRAIENIRQNLDTNLAIRPYFIGFDGSTDFLVLAPVNFDPQDINNIVQSRIIFENVELQISSRIVLVRPIASMSSQTALRNSIATLLQASLAYDSNILEYNATMSNDIADRLALNSSLYNAIDKELGIEVYLQPKIALPNRNIIGAEALCRWFHDGKPVRPDIFVALAEQSGLINKLTDLVIRLVGRFVVSRTELGLSTPPIAINLSIYDLQVNDSANRLHTKFLDAGLSTNTVELEVTESCMIDDTHLVVEQLERLRNFGYKIALDDFGTGYSSLGHLKSLPIDFVKMDKIFIDDLNLQNVQQSIVSLANSISSTMGFKVIAEGVETKEQEAALSAIGCHMCQGYLYHKPLPVAEFNKLLA